MCVGEFGGFEGLIWGIFCKRLQMWVLFWTDRFEIGAVEKSCGKVGKW